MTSLELNIPEYFNPAEYFVHRHLEEGRGDKTAVSFGNIHLTFAEISAQVNRTANLLRAHGVSIGDRVVIVLPDSPAFVVSFWAATQIGAIVVPLNTFLPSETLDRLIQDCGMRCIFVDESLLGRLEGALAHAVHLNSESERDLAVFIVDGAQTRLERPSVTTSSTSSKKVLDVPSPLGLRFLDYEKESLACAPSSQCAPTRRNDPGLCLFTSGSTGEPKGVIHRHCDIMYCLEGFARRVLNVTPADRCFSASKLFFSYGLANALYFPFGVGAETVLDTERMTAERLLSVIARYQPTVLFGVPTLFAAMLRVPGVSGDNLRCVRRGVSAGEPLPAAIAEQFEERFGIQLLDGIGSTEMFHFISNRPGEVRKGSSGKPVPGYEAKIVDDAENEVPVGEIGNLWVKARSAGVGYWNRPAQTLATFRGEWTVTGDRYRVDEQGYYWHCGRRDDMLKINSLWVSPIEIESALLFHPEVAECAVVGFKDEEGFLRPRAYVILKNEESQRSLDELRLEFTSFLKARLSAHKIPSSFVFKDKLPRTASGKIQRFRLREESDDSKPKGFAFSGTKLLS